MHFHAPIVALVNARVTRAKTEDLHNICDKFFEANLFYRILCTSVCLFVNNREIIQDFVETLYDSRKFEPEWQNIYVIQGVH